MYGGFAGNLQYYDFLLSIRFGILCGINIRVQLPAVSMDMKGSIINDGLSFILRQEKEAFWLDHELKLSASAKPSHLLFIMNIDSIQNLMARLEVAI